MPTQSAHFLNSFWDHNPRGHRLYPWFWYTPPWCLRTIDSFTKPKINKSVLSAPFPITIVWSTWFPPMPVQVFTNSLPPPPKNIYSWEINFEVIGTSFQPVLDIISLVKAESMKLGGTSEWVQWMAVWGLKYPAALDPQAFSVIVAPLLTLRLCLFCLSLIAPRTGH